MMKILAFIFTITLMVTIGSAEYKYIPDISLGIHRLPNFVFPKKYQVEITPYFTDEIEEVRGLFNGIVNIFFTSFERKFRLTQFMLHSENLIIQDVKIHLGYKPVYFNYTYIEMDSVLVFDLAERILPDIEYEIVLLYTGEISDGMEGLIQRHYTDEEGNNKTILLTNLAPISARKLYPCFDEPRFKTEIELTVTPIKNYTILPHLDALAIRPPTMIDRGRKDTLKRKMSTYSTSLIVSDYMEYDWGTIKFYIRNDSSHSLRVNKKMILALLADYERVYNFKYEVVMQVDHLYIVGVPKLGPSGGFSSWGALMLDAEYLSGDSRDDPSLKDRQSAMMVMAREMSRQWFGHAVSVDWWSFNWIVEGVALYNVYFGTPSVFTNYSAINIETLFTVEVLHDVLNAEYHNTSRPLNDRTITRAADIALKHYDVIMAGKGAAFFRMLRSCIGGHSFDQMMVALVRKSLYRAINDKTLLRQIKPWFPESYGINVDEFFHDWTEQIGYPVLFVALSKGDDFIELCQERYFPVKDGIYRDPKNRILYTIPLTFATSRDADFEDTTPSHFFTKDKSILRIELKRSIDWIMFNKQQVGFYRVAYSVELYDWLRDALFEDNWSGIPELNRAQYVDDLLSFGETGLLNYDQVFFLLEYLCTEYNYAPWKAALTGFKKLAIYLSAEEYALFGDYILYMARRVYRVLWITEKANLLGQYRYLRNEILDITCRYGFMPCVKAARRMLKQYLHKSIRIPVDIRQTMLCAAMRVASPKDVGDLRKKYNHVKSPVERRRLRFAMGCVQREEDIEEFFDFVLSDEVPVKYKEESLVTLFEENHANVDFVYKLFKERFDDMVTAFNDTIVVVNLISKLTTLFVTDFQMANFEIFAYLLRPKLDDQANDILSDALENVLHKLKWMDLFLPALREYFAQRSWDKCCTASSFVVSFVTMIASVRVPFK